MNDHHRMSSRVPKTTPAPQHALTPAGEDRPEQDYVADLEITLTAHAEVNVRARSPEEARTLINEQLKNRNSTATDAVSEAFTEIIRKETFEYRLDIRDDDNG